TGCRRLFRQPRRRNTTTGDRVRLTRGDGSTAGCPRGGVRRGHAPQPVLEQPAGPAAKVLWAVDILTCAGRASSGQHPGQSHPTFAWRLQSCENLWNAAEVGDSSGRSIAILFRRSLIQQSSARPCRYLLLGMFGAILAHWQASPSRAQVGFGAVGGVFIDPQGMLRDSSSLAPDDLRKKLEASSGAGASS